MINKKQLQKIETVSISDGVSISICRDIITKKILIWRHADRGNIDNFLENYEWISRNNVSELKPLSLDIAKTILKRAQEGLAYSGIFIFYEEESDDFEEIIRDKSQQEHQYTSTGIKFWRHQKQMFSYKAGKGDTVISTHISPEGACNLKCPYCSVTYRDTHSRIELDVIKDYVEKLQTRGLKAVILTGGGEPTSYKYFNELVQWLKYDRNLSIGLITNGTLANKLEDKTFAAFSWVRVSINLFNGWEEKIGNNFDVDKLDPECVVGCSMVYTVEHETTDDIMTDRVEMFNKVSKIADRVGAKYVRLLPNCLLEQKHLVAQHKSLDNTLKLLTDDRFFHQYKVHGTPKSSVCHQSYFRPYLSEEPHHKTGIPGTVYPCDSVVLNDSYQFFAEEYQLCSPEEILEYLDRKIQPKFNPNERCRGCVFTENVDMLDDWVNDKVDRFNEYTEDINHEEFV